MAKNPKCKTCSDDGYYFRLPPGSNPFAASIFVTAARMRKLICTCAAGQQLAEAVRSISTNSNG